MRPKISLDQWQALIAVIEEGSYARAAERLNKSKSTVSYAVSKIENLLNIKVFDLVGRRAELTSIGLALSRQGKFILSQAAQVEERAAYLASGWEPQLRLAIEIIFPQQLLLECLQTFSSITMSPPIELYESVLGGTEELLQNNKVDLAICSQVPNGFVGDKLMHIEFIAAAAPSHPLHQLGRNLTLNDLRNHHQLIIRDSGVKRATRATWEISEPRITVSHINTSIRATSMGLGFAWFPKESIRADLESGAIKPLPLEQGAEHWATLYLVFANPDLVGPGARKLAEIIKEALSTLEIADAIPEAESQIVDLVEA